MDKDEAERLARAIRMVHMDWIKVCGVAYNHTTDTYEVQCAYQQEDQGGFRHRPIHGLPFPLKAFPENVGAYYCLNTSLWHPALSTDSLCANGRNWHPSLCGHRLANGDTPMDAVCLVVIRVSLSPTVHRAYASFNWHLGNSLFLLPLLSLAWLVLRVSDHSLCLYVKRAWTTV